MRHTVYVLLSNEKPKSVDSNFNGERAYKVVLLYHHFIHTYITSTITLMPLHDLLTLNRNVGRRNPAFSCSSVRLHKQFRAIGTLMETSTSLLIGMRVCVCVLHNYVIKGLLCEIAPATYPLTKFWG